jgi:hypothetical protein
VSPKLPPILSRSPLVYDSNGAICVRPFGQVMLGVSVTRYLAPATLFDSISAMYEQPAGRGGRAMRKRIL